MTAGTATPSQDAPGLVDRFRPFAPYVTPPAVLAFLAVRPAVETPTLCPFAIVTGHACPLCGGTRAASALIRGDLDAAWSFHPLVFLVAPLVVAMWMTWIRSSRDPDYTPNPSVVNRLTLVLGVVFLAVWIARLATGTLPAV